MDEQTRKTMMSSTHGRWETPGPLYDALDAEFHFTLDACATPRTSLAPLYLDDAFNDPWKGRVFINPPYGKGEKVCKTNCKKKTCAKRGKHTRVDIPGMDEWAARIITERPVADVIVALLPARTDTRWWHLLALAADEVRLLSGRQSFTVKGKKQDAAPFPSCIMIFTPPKKGTVTRGPAGYPYYINAKLWRY